MLITTLMRVVLYRFGENKISEQPSQREYERVTWEIMPELLKTTLISKTSGALYRCLSMQIDDLATYRKTTLIVANNCGASTPSPSMRPHATPSSRTTCGGGPVPSEIGAPYRRK